MSTYILNVCCCHVFVLLLMQHNCVCSFNLEQFCHLLSDENHQNFQLEEKKNDEILVFK